MLDDSLHEHRQAFLNLAVQAQKKAGKGKTRPVYRRFEQFFNYDRELDKLKSRKKQKKSRKKQKKSRFSGIGKLLKKGG